LPAHARTPPARAQQENELLVRQGELLRSSEAAFRQEAQLVSGSGVARAALHEDARGEGGASDADTA
jgi:hypothetical protein